MAGPLHGSVGHNCQRSGHSSPPQGVRGRRRRHWRACRGKTLRSFPGHLLRSSNCPKKNARSAFRLERGFHQRTDRALWQRDRSRSVPGTHRLRCCRRRRRRRRKTRRSASGTTPPARGCSRPARGRRNSQWAPPRSGTRSSTAPDNPSPRPRSGAPRRTSPRRRPTAGRGGRTQPGRGASPMSAHRTGTGRPRGTGSCRTAAVRTPAAAARGQRCRRGTESPRRRTR
mmetsp:Transcript_26054/g.77140  ORF Transcript_26054/g.77140 Transcript_26054/m.77140 type:complete len:228 (-) Transcript_26054:1327-2010(-)